MAWRRPGAEARARACHAAAGAPPLTPSHLRARAAFGARFRRTAAREAWCLSLPMPVRRSAPATCVRGFAASFRVPFTTPAMMRPADYGGTSRETCAVRACARRFTIGGATGRTDCAVRAADAGADYRPAPTRARGRAASRPSQTARHAPPNSRAANGCRRGIPRRQPFAAPTAKDTPTRT